MPGPAAISRAVHRPVIVLGAGGHCRVLLDVLALLGRRVLFLTDDDAAKHGSAVAGCSVRGGHGLILEHTPDSVELVNALGSVRQPTVRRAFYMRYTQQGYRFTAAVHPSAVIAADVRLEYGAQIMAGAVVQPGSCVGENALINTRASIDHDCQIGPHTHIAPGVTLSGGVSVGAMAHIGTGATVIQGVRIGQGAVVGAGAVVLRDIPDQAVAYGVPARVVSSSA